MKGKNAKAANSKSIHIATSSFFIGRHPATGYGRFKFMKSELITFV
jgi:hypothetical protein